MANPLEEAAGKPAAGLAFGGELAFGGDLALALGGELGRGLCACVLGGEVAAGGPSAAGAPAVTA